MAFHGPPEPGLEDVLAEVRRIEVQSRRLVKDVMAGGYVSVFRGAGLEFETVREYEEGDAPRHIDWNVTARMGRRFVKTYVDERELSVMFVLDTSESMDGGYGLWSARQTAARICGCLAFSAAHNNDKLGLVAGGASVAHHVPPRKGLGQALRIVRDCLVLRSHEEQSDLGPLIARATRSQRRRAIVFVLSDFLARGWEEAMRQARRRHDVVAVPLQLPEMLPPRAGLVRLRDPESGRGMLVDLRQRRLREAWADRARAHKAGVAERFRRLGVDVMPVDVPVDAESDPIAGPILRFFRMREQRGQKR